MNLKLRLRDIATWHGEIERGEFLAWGLILFAIKYNLDRVTAWYFGRDWFIVDYVIQADQSSVSGIEAIDRNFFLALLVLSLPFIWFGTVLCVKRLRSAGLPEWLVVVFFVPFLNLIVFIVLSVIPNRQVPSSGQSSAIGRIIPKSRLGSAMFGIALVSLVALAMMWLLINRMNEYGWSLFVGVPFFLGFGVVLIYGFHQTLTYRQAIGVSFLATVLFGMLVFILALEGIICIAMALPIFFVIAIIGASVGYAIHSNRRHVAMHIFAIPVIFIPVAGFVEGSGRLPQTTSVVTSVIINAPRQIVWEKLVAFSDIDAPPELLFQTGIAYPVNAQITGEGVGAIRKCNFTTGSFIEPITIWDEPAVLEFGVLDQPPPMVELSIYSELSLPHLDGYFQSEKGRFDLKETADGQTLLIGTTWYHYDIWPAIYWKQWSDFILHRIHQRVLLHIKKEAESAQ